MRESRLGHVTGREQATKGNPGLENLRKAQIENQKLRRSLDGSRSNLSTAGSGTSLT